MNAINDYYYAKEREESAVQRINDLYLEALNSLEKLEAENAKLRELIADVHESLCADKAGMFHKLILVSMEDDMRELGVDMP